MEDIRKSLEEQKTKVEKAIRIAQQTIKNSPKGRLRTSKSNNYFHYFYHEEEETVGAKGSRGIYIPKSGLDFAKKLAQKEYCGKLLEKAEKLLKEIKKLERIYDRYPLEAVFSNLCAARKNLVEPVVYPIEEYIRKWEAVEYTPGVFDENDNSEYYSAKGERVRSKSEKIISDELFMAGIPYRYEFPLKLYVFNQERIFRPDFTVLNKRTGRQFIIEHFGMMDNSSYYNNTLQKLDAFEQNGFLIGRDILLFHESTHKPLSNLIVKQYIEEFLL